MTVKQLAKALLSLRPDLQNKDVVVKAENGLLLSAKIRLQLIDETSLDHSGKNVKQIVINY